MKTKQEKKAEHSVAIMEKLKHLENHAAITFEGLDDDSIYYHPLLTIEEGVFIRMQCDVGSNSQVGFYAATFTSQLDRMNHIPLYEDYIENVVVSWKNNKHIVLMAFDVLKKVNNHVEKMRGYTQDYINNLLIGNSISDLSTDFINEIKTTTKVIELMQTTKNK